MISAQFPEPFGTAVNTAKVCFHIYMVSLVAISYYTLYYLFYNPNLPARRAGKFGLISIYITIYTCR